MSSWYIITHCDPISTSALADEPTLTSNAWSKCQKAGFTASLSFENVPLHWLGWSLKAICKEVMWCTNRLRANVYCTPGKCWDGSGINRLMTDAGSQNSRRAVALFNLTSFSNTEILMLSCTNKNFGFLNQVVFREVCLWRLGSEWVCNYGRSNQVNLGQWEESHGTDSGNHGRTERTPAVGWGKNRGGIIKS